MPSDPGHVLGQTVRLYRHKFGWTQESLARRLKLAGLQWSAPQVAFFEGGRRVDITLSEVLLIAKVLGVRLVDLFRGSGSLGLGTPHDLAEGRYVETPLAEVQELLKGGEPSAWLRAEPPPYSLTEEGFARQLGLHPGEVKALIHDLKWRSIEEEQEARVRRDDPHTGLDWLLTDLSDELSSRAGLPTKKESLNPPHPGDEP